MGELVVGRPALKLNYVVSLPLDLVSVMSLLYRAVPGSGLDPWLIATRRSLTDEIREDLDLLHGFSGRLLYFMEEPVMAFDPLHADRIDASFEDLVQFLQDLPATDYVKMIDQALERVHRDLGTGMTGPFNESTDARRAFIDPALTTANSETVLAFYADPESLKHRVLRLLTGIWEQVYASEWERHNAALHEAAKLATGTAGFGFAMAFVELTGNRMPSTLISGANAVESVTFCPSYHLGSFISYTIFAPNLVIFFDAPGFIQRLGGKITPNSVHSNGHNNGSASEGIRNDVPAVSLNTEEILECLRALGDANRLRVIDLLSGGELYAQEIVGRLGIAQSAVSRHLALLERAGLVRVRPRGGMKYYAVDRARLDALAEGLRGRSGALI